MRNCIEALTRVATWIQDNRMGDLRSLTQETALRFLELRSEEVGQKTLDQERLAMQIHLGTKLPKVTSEYEQVLKSRAYTKDQMEMVAAVQTEKNALATQIAYAAGLRAHELLTLQRKEERAASTHRAWSNLRFTGRIGEIYTVKGKGGLIREVMIPTGLAKQLEAKRLAKPKIIKDRTIQYQSYYEIGGGRTWSSSFTAASNRALGWSNGAHGLRHAYAQSRMSELQQQGFLYDEALALVSQLLGHFRAEITEVYLR
jgi:integrase